MPEYDAAKGYLTKITYHAGAGSDSAVYHYDDAARLTKMTDWLDATNGIRYGYDDRNRLTSITDYDNSVLSFAYDDLGRVTSMNDYHSSVTSYTYDANSRLSTLTAPGSKTWDFDYNVLGQPTQYLQPNGVTTMYYYDSQHRMTRIEHKDGPVTLDGYHYTLDDTGVIDSMVQLADGSEWSYFYDGRNRLTKAVRDNDVISPTISATWEYAYDLGDNMVTKVHPFEDGFDDGNYTGWNVAESWDASNGYLDNAPSSTGYPRFWKSATDADYDLRFSYLLEDDTDTAFYTAVMLRNNTSGDTTELRIKPDTLILRENVASTWSTLAEDASADTVANTWYDVRIVADGSNITVWRGEQGGPMTEVLSTSSSGVYDSSMYRWMVFNEAEFRFDDIMIVTDDFSSTTTFTHTAANELSTMTQPDGSVVNFEFDDWGRMTRKHLGTTYDTTYAYKYGQMLTGVTSDFPGEGNATFTYASAGTRQQSTISGDTTKYRWLGFSTISEESATGTLQKTYVSGLAEVEGANPSTGSYRYPIHDQVGSRRGLRDDNKVLLAKYEYTPYGLPYSTVANAEYGEPHFGRLHGDTGVGIQYAFARYYSAQTGTWTTRDPFGFFDGFNIYRYGRSNPAMYSDALGLSSKDCLQIVEDGLDLLGLTPGVGNAADIANVLVNVAQGDVKGIIINLGSAVPIAGAAANGAKAGKTISGVYEFSVKGEKYVGQSSDIVKRYEQHLGKYEDLEDFKYYPLPGANKGGRRLNEQALMEARGKAQSSGGTLLNKINSISKKLLNKIKDACS